MWFLVLLFGLGECANDNSLFIMAPAFGSENQNGLVGCAANFWLSTGEQIAQNAANNYLLNDTDWQWQHDGSEIVKGLAGDRITFGIRWENPYDVWQWQVRDKINDPQLKLSQQNFNGVHYWLKITKLRESDAGTYSFVANVPGKTEQRILRFKLSVSDSGRACPDDKILGAKEPLVDNGANWDDETNYLTDHVFMVGPYNQGAPRERFRLTKIKILAKKNGFDPTGNGDCFRFGYNFKLQIFDINYQDVTATAVNQQDIIVPWDAIQNNQNFALIRDMKEGDPNGFDAKIEGKGSQSFYTVELTIPQWYAKQPLLVSQGQFVGISTEGCMSLYYGQSQWSINTQRGFYSQGPVKKWEYNEITKPITAQPAFLGKPVPIIDAGGAFSFQYTAEYYDIEPLPKRVVIPPPPPEEPDYALYILLILLAIFVCCCLICCCLSSKDRKRQRERRMFKAQMIREQPNISTETGEALPRNWFEEKDTNGNIYYYNPVSGESMWDIPCVG